MHSATKKGANPELRLLFFRLLRLSKLPFILVFVFDGSQRPKVKRGSKMGKSGSHALTQEFKKLLNTFGIEWRMVSAYAAYYRLPYGTYPRPWLRLRLNWLTSTGSES